MGSRDMLPTVEDVARATPTEIRTLFTLTRCAENLRAIEFRPRRDELGYCGDATNGALLFQRRRLILSSKDPASFAIYQVDVSAERTHKGFVGLGVGFRRAICKPRLHWKSSLWAPIQHSSHDIK
jgi:hypothetical protein